MSLLPLRSPGLLFLTILRHGQVSRPPPFGGAVLLFLFFPLLSEHTSGHRGVDLGRQRLSGVLGP